MTYSDQMMRLLSTASLAEMALSYVCQNAVKPLDSTEIQFRDAINGELIRRGAMTK